MASIEKLVGYGADMNVTASTGNSALHETLSSFDMEKPSNDTPEIKKVILSISVTFEHSIERRQEIYGFFKCTVLWHAQTINFCTVNGEARLKSTGCLPVGFVSSI